MKKLVCVAAGVFALLFPVLSKGRDKNDVQFVQMRDFVGKNVGQIVVRDEGPGVMLDLHLHGLTPGEHAIHFHQVPNCEGSDFKAAGPHYNPDGKKHGFENPEGHHAGDMKNFTVGQNGKAKVSIEDPDVTLKPGPRQLSSVAIVIHAKADDYQTDPLREFGRSRGVRRVSTLGRTKNCTIGRMARRRSVSRIQTSR